MATRARTQSRGITLIGVLIATFILLTGVLAVAQLIARTERTAGVSRERFIAVNVAREGIELAQVLRDNAWFALQTGDDDTDTWADGLCDDFNGPDRRLAIDLNPDNTINVVVDPSAGEQQLYVDGDAKWSHISGGGEATRYSRLVTVDCEERELGPGADPALSQERLIVRSEVRWERQGQPQSVAVTSHLYNWLNP